MADDDDEAVDVDNSLKSPFKAFRVVRVEHGEAIPGAFIKPLNDKFIGIFAGEVEALPFGSPEKRAIEKYVANEGKPSSEGMDIIDVTGKPIFRVPAKPIGKRAHVPRLQATRGRRKKAKPINVQLYMDTNDAVTSMKVLQAVTDVLASAGYDKTKIDRVVKGSIRLRVKAWLDGPEGQKAQAVGKQKLGDALTNAEQAIKDATVNKQRAEISAINAGTASKLVDACKDVDNMALQMDEWLLVKHTDGQGKVHVSTRKLSVMEMSVLSRYPAILNKPAEVLDKLSLLAYEKDQPEEVAFELEG